jgi:cellulose synthase/poly-beta-1,6-N-acetylglucosamine synthase-like glycosyltransferase
MNNKPGKPVLAIVVSCYNEQEVLPETAKRLCGTLQQPIYGQKIDEI